MIREIIEEIAERNDRKKLTQLWTFYTNISSVSEIKHSEYFAEAYETITKIETLVYLEETFDCVYYSETKRVVTNKGNYSKAIILVNLDELLRRWKFNKKEAYRQDKRHLRSLLIRTIAQLNEVQLPHSPTIRVFNLDLDNRFTYLPTRDKAAEIRASPRAQDLKDVNTFTTAFSKEIKYLEGIWGTDQGTLLYSERFNFHIAVNYTHYFETFENFRREVHGEATDPLIIGLVNFDKAIPYIVYALQKRKHILSIKSLSRTFRDRGRRFPPYIRPPFYDMAYVEYTAKQIDKMIPEYDGVSRDGLLSFISEVDAVRRDTDPANVEQLNNISITVRNHLKGKARDYVSTIQNEWPQIRRVLMTLGCIASEERLVNELAMAEQGNLSVEQYYAKINNIARNLIIVRTRDMNSVQAAAAKTEILNSARDKFLNGLDLAIADAVNARHPGTLTEAMELATEREKKVNQRYQHQAPQLPIEEVIEKIVCKMQNVVPQNKSSPEQVIKSNTGSYNSDKRCYNCNKTGHISRNCRSPRRQQNNNDNQYKAPYDGSKYCSFHKAPGHTLSECRSHKMGKPEPVMTIQHQNTRNSTMQSCQNHCFHQPPTYSQQPQQVYMQPGQQPQIPYAIQGQQPQYAHPLQHFQTNQQLPQQHLNSKHHLQGASSGANSWAPLTNFPHNQ